MLKIFFQEKEVKKVEEVDVELQRALALSVMGRDADLGTRSGGEEDAEVAEEVAPRENKRKEEEPTGEEGEPARKEGETANETDEPAREPEQGASSGAQKDAEMLPPREGEVEQPLEEEPAREDVVEARLPPQGEDRVTEQPTDNEKWRWFCTSCNWAQHTAGRGGKCSKCGSATKQICKSCFRYFYSWSPHLKSPCTDEQQRNVVYITRAKRFHIPLRVKAGCRFLCTACGKQYPTTNVAKLSICHQSPIWRLCDTCNVTWAPTSADHFLFCGRSANFITAIKLKRKQIREEKKRKKLQDQQKKKRKRREKHQHKRRKVEKKRRRRKKKEKTRSGQVAPAQQQAKQRGRKRKRIPGKALRPRVQAPLKVQPPKKKKQQTKKKERRRRAPPAVAPVGYTGQRRI